jgi:hypothetical protein
MILVIVFDMALELLHIDRIEEPVEAKQQFLMAQWYVSFAIFHQLVLISVAK